MDMVLHLNPNAKLFGADALGNKIRLKFRATKEKVKKTLSKVCIPQCYWQVCSRISYTTDVWTSPLTGGLPFMALTAHWIDDDFKMRHMLMDFTVRTCFYSHVSAYAAHTLENV